MATTELIAKIVTVGAKKATDELKAFSKEADKAQNTTDGLNTKKMAVGMAKVGVAALTAGAAIATFTIKMAQSVDDMSDMAERAGLTYNELNKLSYVFGTVGMSAEETAKVMMKTNKAVGQLTALGVGPLAKALDALEERTNLTAESFVGLAGPQVLQKLVTEMERANVSSKEQAFILESVAKGSTKLIPLLANQAKELTNLTEEYNKYNKQFELTDDQIDTMGELADKWDLFEVSMSNAAKILAVSAAPLINSSLNSILETMGSLTEAAQGFFTAMDAAKDVPETYDGLLAKIDEVTSAYNRASDAASNKLANRNERQIAKDKADALNNELIGLNARATQMRALQSLSDEEKKNVKAAADAVAIAEEAKQAVLQETARRVAKAAKTKAEQEKAEQDALKALHEKWYNEDLEAEQFFQTERLKAVAVGAGKIAQQIISIQENAHFELMDLQRRGVLDEQQIELMRQQQLQETTKFVEREHAARATAIISAAIDVAELEHNTNQVRELELKLFYQNTKTDLDKHLEEKLISEEKYADAIKALDVEISERRKSQQHQDEADLLNGYAQFSNSLSDVNAATLQAMEAFDVGSEKMRKATFYKMKAFSMATASLSLGAAIAQAAADWSNATVPGKLAAMAAIGAAVGNVISQMSSAQYTPAREQGGQFNKGTYLVGEKGPEMVQFGSGGRIANTNDTNKMLGGSGNIEISIINQTRGSFDNVEQQQMDDGRIVLIVQETLNAEVMNPNSRFNKGMNKTRNIQRKL